MTSASDTARSAKHDYRALAVTTLRARIGR